ncbi:enoyl-CoA hydratase/isomerase family protein [Leptospira sp. 201903075]|uniref:enoyl-CoA hydratase/isomerase family protein n=1 Tax=Leptospira chreensis TaxID=2810035 RepID=UPI001964D84F|nr:enoyl-CoA hydratase/isomerase family protein [Leptospira chreensis]MBM9592295.1 enoyl-CoA hydratase/isomerase family protein [Leptospira chreensis]
MKSRFESKEYEFLEIESRETEDGKIVSIFLNNPTSRNSMTWKMGEEFADLIQSIKKEKVLPRAIIVSGRNDVFCAGGDLNLLRSFSEKSFSQNRRDMRKFYGFFLSVRKLPVPVIAAVNGHAIGAGLSLTFGCDLRIFAEEGKYSFNFVRLGIHPGMGSSFLSPELLGKSLGGRLLLTGETFDGKFAKTCGLALDSVPKTEVYARAMDLALSLSKAAPLALQELKKNLYSWKQLDSALKKEAESQARNFISDDFKETIKSILEKREPKFTGK